MAPKFNQHQLQPQLKLDTTQTKQKISSYNSVDDLKKAFPTCFDGIGNFPGEYLITVDPNIQPTQHARRKIPIELKDKIKAKRDKMTETGIITQVEEPTAWVNSMTYPVKPNRDICLCLDPKDLNKGFMCEHYKAPTLEEITHQLTGAKVFPKLDTAQGFYAITLDYHSSLLTTFNTPFGRYRYLYLPFYLKCSQDIFQMRMDQLLLGLPGILAVHDDVTVYGKDDDNHNAALSALMWRAEEKGLVFSSSKCFIKQPKIKFF